MSDDKRTELRLILSMAPSFQGGHCKTGNEVAEYLGIPFPLTTANLEKKAKAFGFDPYDLWPWLKQIRNRRPQPDYDALQIARNYEKADGDV